MINCNNLFIFTNRIKIFKLRLHSFSTSCNLYQKFLNEHLDRLKPICFFPKSKLFSNKKMAFKVKTSTTNIFFKKNISFFKKTNKKYALFGLKHIKNKTEKAILRLNFQDLNFATKSLFSLNKDLGLNPFFGGISRGFSKLLVRIKLKEYLNVFLRPKWYRIAKFQNFKLKIIKKTDLFYINSKFLFNENNFFFFYNFFYKKRWFLVHVLKKNDK